MFFPQTAVSQGLGFGAGLEPQAARPPACCLRPESVIQHCTHGSILIRRRRGHPGVVLPLVVSNSADH